MYELRSCRQNPDARIQNFCPRIPKPETYDKWYAESGPFEQKVPEPEQRSAWLRMSKKDILSSLDEIKDKPVDWDFSYLSSKTQERMLSSKKNSGSTLPNIAEAPLARRETARIGDKPRPEDITPEDMIQTAEFRQNVTAQMIAAKMQEVAHPTLGDSNILKARAKRLDDRLRSQASSRKNFLRKIKARRETARTSDKPLPGDIMPPQIPPPTTAQKTALTQTPQGIKREVDADDKVEGNATPPWCPSRKKEEQHSTAASLNSGRQSQHGKSWASSASPLVNKDPVNVPPANETAIKIVKAPPKSEGPRPETVGLIYKTRSQQVKTHAKVQAKTENMEGPKPEEPHPPNQEGSRTVATSSSAMEEDTWKSGPTFGTENVKDDKSRETGANSVQYPLSSNNDKPKPSQLKAIIGGKDYAISPTNDVPPPPPMETNANDKNKLHICLQPNTEVLAAVKPMTKKGMKSPHHPQQ